MDLHSGNAFWPIKNGLLANDPALVRDETCDVAVIGGGITAALVAYRLINEGVETVLLDKRDIGTGSTAASTSLLQYEIDTELHDLIPRVSEAGAVRAYQVGLDAIDQIEELLRVLGDECGFERKTSLYLACKISHVDTGLLATQLRQSQARYQTVCVFDLHGVTTPGRHLSV